MRRSVLATTHVLVESSLVNLVHGFNLMCKSSGIREA